MDHFDANGFRSNVGIIVARDDCTLLLGGRTRQSGWQFPQGGIQVDENPLQAMYRELHEEIGLDADQVTVLGQTEGWLHYRLPSKYIRRNSAPLCIGQRQRWFLLQLRDPDQRFDLQTTDEHYQRAVETPASKVTQIPTLQVPESGRKGPQGLLHRIGASALVAELCERVKNGATLCEPHRIPPRGFEPLSPG